METKRASVEEIEREFRKLLDDDGLLQPDEVEPDCETGEVTFIWHEPRLVVVVEP